MLTGDCVYDTSTGVLYYDVDGLDGRTAIPFSSLGTTTHPSSLSASDFVVVA
jgi:hypothetical protein